jgi:6-phosphogluconolactonase
MGPDGHVASLFPGQIEPDTHELVVAVPNSPKPPAQRLSLSLWLLNSSERVWIFAAGSEKAQAVANLLDHEDIMKTPACGLEGRFETLVYIDEAAASKRF